MKINFNNEANLKSYAQVVADIAMIAQCIISEYNYFDYDSINLTMDIADWAMEFEEAWHTLGLNDNYNVDYIEMVDTFANMKLAEFFEDIPCTKFKGGYEYE